MAVEVGKARHAKVPEEELARVVFIAADGSQAKALDLRMMDSNVHFKLEYPDGKIAWFQMEPDDTLRIERRARHRAPHPPPASEEDGPSRQKRPKTARLEPDSFRLTLTNGDERDAVELARVGTELRVTLLDPDSNKPVHRILQSNDILTSISPRRELELVTASSSIGESIRQQIINSLSNQSASIYGSPPSQSQSIPIARNPTPHDFAPDTGVVYKTKMGSGAYKLHKETVRPKEPTLVEHLRGASKATLAGLVLLCLPIGYSAWCLYDTIRLYSDPPFPAGAAATPQDELLLELGQTSETQPAADMTTDTSPADQEGVSTQKRD